MAADPNSHIGSDNDGRGVVDVPTNTDDEYVRAPVVAFVALKPDGTFGPISPDAPLPIFNTPRATDVITKKGMSTAGSAIILEADPLRTALTIRNASNTQAQPGQMFYRLDGIDADDTDYPLDSGRGYEFPPNMIPKGAVTVYCATGDKKWVVLYATKNPDDPNA